MEDLLLENWEKLGQVALMTIASFVILFLFIRISGKEPWLSSTLLILWSQLLWVPHWPI